MAPTRAVAHATTSVRLLLRPAMVLRLQAVAIGGLVTASLLGQISKYFLGHDVVFGLVSLFNLDGEGNVPTWYQASSLLVCAFLLAAIGAAVRAARRRFAFHWLGLAVVFLFMSADEASFIHELTNPLFRSWWRLPSFLYYSWVLAGFAFLCVFLLVYAHFIRALPAATRRRFLGAGALYVAGAMGVELVGAWLAVRSGIETFAYAVQTTIEETLEMAGVALFVFALLDHIGEAFGEIAVGTTNPPGGIAAPTDRARTG